MQKQVFNSIAEIIQPFNQQKATGCGAYIRRHTAMVPARCAGLAETHARHLLEAAAYNLYRVPGIIVSAAQK